MDAMPRIDRHVTFAMTDWRSLLVNDSAATSAVHQSRNTMCGIHAHNVRVHHKISAHLHYALDMYLHNDRLMIVVQNVEYLLHARCEPA